MVTLRLFRQDAPFRQIEARIFSSGELTIGRDSATGWTIGEADLTVSRVHCALALQDGLLMLTDLSANGVLIGQRRIRPPAGEPVALAPGESFRLGEYMVLVDAAEHALESEPETASTSPAASLEATSLDFDAPFTSPLLQRIEGGAGDLEAPRHWADPTPTPTKGAPVRPETAAALIDAFCAGARLEASAFAEQDPLVLMRRLGEVYQYMVLGVAEQMNARTSLRTEYRMDRTSVGSEANNPFKWAPAQRVAVDLLRTRDDGFLEGPQAVQASFADMQKHLLCMLAGLRAAVAVTFDSLGPEAVEARLEGRSFLLKNRDAAAWTEYLKLHGDLGADAPDNPDSPLNRAFRAAYDQRLQELDASGPAA